MENKLEEKHNQLNNMVEIIDKVKFNKALEKYSAQYERDISNQEARSQAQQQPADKATESKSVRPEHSYTQEEWEREMYRGGYD